MHVISHEHVGMNITLMLVSCVFELFKIELIVTVLINKNILAIIAPLNDLLWLASYYETR